MKYAGPNSAHIHCIQFHSIIISAKKMNWYQPLVNWFNQKAPKNWEELNQGNFSFLVMTQLHGIVFQLIWCNSTEAWRFFIVIHVLPKFQMRHEGSSFYGLGISDAGVDKELCMIFAYFIVLIMSYSIINIDWRAGWL